MIKHLNITITGKVQRSGFRFAAILAAQELGLFGFVEYKEKSVYIEVEGEVEHLKKFLGWCHKGPEGSLIEKVDYESTEDLKNFKDFKAKTEEDEY